MADQLTTGIRFEKTITVTEALAVTHLAGQGIGVFSTPELVRFVEMCALEGTRPYLHDGGPRRFLVVKRNPSYK